MNATTGSSTMADQKVQMLRHALATLAYRAGKALRDVPDGFAGFKSGESARTPGQILAHMCDLLNWALSQAKGSEAWRGTDPAPWNEDTHRFFAALSSLDTFLATAKDVPAERIFQGAIADALTHVGQKG